jgi:formylglycine-generating enzyme required for sulfatase activity
MIGAMFAGSFGSIVHARAPSLAFAGFALLSFLLVPLAAGEDKEQAALAKAYETARDELGRAEESLITAYEALESEWRAAAAAPDEFATRLASALRARAGEFAPRFQAGASGRAPQTGQLVQAARDWLLAAAVDGGASGEFAGALAAQLADPLRETLTALGNGAAPTLDAVLAERLRPLLEPERDFAAVWNDHLFREIAAAREYATRFTQYREAGLKLERARSPDKFDAKGQRLPPGMVLVKGGSYEIGPDVGLKRRGYERRAGKITLKPFFLDRTEVTCADYLRYLKSLEKDRRRERLPDGWFMDAEFEPSHLEDRADHPVTGVDFNDAFDYARSVGKRLPTEEEWEAAARGPKAFLWPWGNQYSIGFANDRESGRGGTAPVGSFLEGASPFGCLDLAGNVEEWTASRDDGELITAELTETLVQAVTRGGNFNSSSEYVAANVRWYSPGATTRKPTLGFRCAMSAAK